MLILAPAVAVLAGCTGDLLTPERVMGVYQLKEVDGKPLPVVCGWTAVHAASIELRSDGTLEWMRDYTQTVYSSYEGQPPGPPRFVVRGGGAYELRGRQVVLRFQDATGVVTREAPLEGRRMTVGGLFTCGDGRERLAVFER
ncbi:MAG TPA: hypothetical protein VGR37_21175 [Longimicrobiaceae bacterium]|nr:hypothetical protein [Longimicrobiaceae bacterium]